MKNIFKNKTVVKGIALALAVCTVVGVSINKNMFKSSASEPELVWGENAEEEVVFTAIFEENFDNLENMTDEEFTAVFDSEEYVAEFEEIHSEENTRGGIDGFINMIRRIYKKYGIEGIKRLVNEIVKKLPKIIIHLLEKHFGKNWKQKLVNVLVQIAKAGFDGIGILKRELKLDDTLAKVVAELILKIGSSI